MRTIKIRKDTIEQMKNIICINGDNYNFTSKRKLNHFLARVNNDTSYWLVELNELYISVFSEYRRAWFLMRSQNGKTNLRAESICLTHLQAVEDRFNHITSVASGTMIVFVNLKKICLFLSIAAAELETIHKNKNNTMQRHALRIINKRLTAITYEIANYKPLVIE